MKRILYLENGVGFGGAVTSLKSFLNRLDRGRYEPVLVHSLDDPRFDMFRPAVRCLLHPRAAGCKDFSEDGAVKIEGIWGSARYYASCVMLEALRLARLVRSERAHLLHLNNDINCNLAGLLAARLTGRPVVLHERAIADWISSLARIAVRRVDAFIAISQVCRQALLDVGIPAARIHVVPEGLDLAECPMTPESTLLRLREELGLPPEAPVVLIAGLLMPWKGQATLLAAAAHVLRELPDCRFVLVGDTPSGNEAYAAELRRTASAPPLTGRILFTGFRQDVMALMQAADVVVHASTSPEPFGRVIIEAMAMERPVVSTTIGAPAEIIDHGRTGILVPPADPPRLAEALRSLLVDTARRRAMGTAARREVATRYGIDAHARAIERIYQALVG